MKSPAVRDVAGLDHTRHPRHRAQDATFRPMVLISLWQDRSSDPNERLASPGEFCEALIIDADEPDTITGSTRLDQPFALLKIQLIQVFDCAFQDQRETRRVKIKSRLAPRRVRLEHVITLAEESGIVRVDQQSPQAPDHPAPGLITQRPRFVKKVYNGMVAKDPLGKIIVITADLKAQRERRDNLIKEALTEGYSLRDVAEAAELSHTAIAKIRDRQLS